MGRGLASMRGWRIRALTLAVVACGATVGGGAAGQGPVVTPTPPGRIEVLAINGGGSAARNYQSHLLHLRQLVDVLRWAGVSAGRITILAGDGEDPGADVALREVQPEDDYWRVTGTYLERPFRTPVTYESSSVRGFDLRPATRSEVQRWFRTRGPRLERGDTLLLYVTDHGTKNKGNTRDNRITLWGKNEALSVSELRAHLETLDPGVEVVMLMSQCYSGSFAHLAWRGGASLPDGGTCGYFSTTAERPAYGCYPEIRDVDNVGHSFDFIQGLAATGSFRNAHLNVLLEDQTPDVPLRTLDVFIEELLREKARQSGQDFDAYVDSLLAEAWRHRGAWEPEIRLLDAIGEGFGSFSPRTLAEIGRQTAELPEVSRQLKTHGKAWKDALGDANRATVGRFLARDTDWAERVGPQQVKDLGPGGRDLAGAFLFDLAEYTRRDAWTSARLDTLRGKSEEATEAAYRMEVRLGVVLRMRAILTSIAGRVYLAREGTSAEREAHERLLECEGLTLPLRGPVPGSRLVDRDPFPPLEDDLRVARDVLPAWMGIRFREPRQAARGEHELTRGAASVQAVYPDSPAEEAGLEPGDVVLGPPEAHFTDPGQIREWTMLATVDQPALLDVLRGDETLQLTLVPRPYPMKWPELPGPIRAMNAAPPWGPLQLGAYRGTLPSSLGKGKAHLLYFWATWCGPCKAAVPELMDFEREKGIEVIAITDEPAETLDAFFQGYRKPFPEHVATDVDRRAFLAYGVSGTPTFVLVDEKGIVSSYSRGYSPGKSLGVEGWSWKGGAATGSH